MWLTRCVKTALVAGALLLSGSAFGQTVEEFYKGKTVSLYIGYSVGGGYDVYARVVAAHIGRHIPGNPTVIPVNMPGAGSLRLANWLFDAAPRDGTASGAVARAVPFEPLLRNKAANFKAVEFNYIGNANVETSLCAFNASSGVKTVEDLRSRQVLVGGGGAASDPNQHTNAINAALDTKMKIIDGYPGGNDIVLAMEQGEVAGRCGWSWSTIKVSNMDWVKTGKINLVVQLGKQRHPELPNVPLASDLTTTELGREILNFVVAPLEMGRPYIAPPGVPQDRVDALRAAFDATMADPEFLASAKAAGLDITPSTGQALQKIVTDVYATDPEIIDQLVKALN